MFKSRKALEVHSRIHSGIKKYVCDYDGCGKAFFQKGNLVAHRSTHLPPEEKVFQCPYCPKCLASKESANVHIRSHQDKQYRCELCFRDFLRPSMLQRHITLAHGTHRYACQFCPLVVKQKSTFIRHLGNRHPEFIAFWTEEGKLRF